MRSKCGKNPGLRWRASPGDLFPLMCAQMCFISAYLLTPESEPIHPTVSKKKAPKVFPNWSSLWTIKPLSGAISAGVTEFAAPANSWCGSEWKVCRGSSGTWAGESRVCNWGRLGLIEGCFNAVRGWQVGIITSYLFMQKTPWLTFNECSMRAGYKCRVNSRFITMWKRLLVSSALLFVSRRMLDLAGVGGGGSPHWRPPWMPLYPLYTE